jgi:enoyl-CoA hydratase/carnithine racemase
MSELLVERQGHITIFTLNRPERMNALTQDLIHELEAGIKEFNKDPEQYVAIITGAGQKAFCAGGDLKAMAENVAGSDSLPMSYQPDIAGVGNSEKPVIAAINGLAVAGGLELALCCDIRMASDDAWLGVFEVARGIMAGVAVSLLPRLMPFGAVMDLMLSGERMTAADAHRLGLIQAVVAKDKLLEAAVAKAEAIARQSQPAVWGTKKVLRFWRDALLAEQQRYYEAVVHRVLLSGDMLEGPKAFAEKRTPQFNNRWPDPFKPF